jgi:hypothetical protein
MKNPKRQRSDQNYPGTPSKKCQLYPLSIGAMGSRTDSSWSCRRLTNCLRLRKCAESSLIMLVSPKQMTSMHSQTLIERRGKGFTKIRECFIMLKYSPILDDAPELSNLLQLELTSHQHLGALLPLLRMNVH